MSVRPRRVAGGGLAAARRGEVVDGVGGGAEEIIDVELEGADRKALVLLRVRVTRLRG
jgi:hypothetical protein